MRFAILPLIPTARHVLSESDFLVYSHLLDQADRMKRGYFLYCLTEKQKPFVGIRNRNNVTYVFNQESDEFYYQQSSVPHNFIDLFNPLLGAHYIDMVITSRSGAAAMMSKLLWDKRVSEPEIGIAIIEPKVITDESTHNALCFQDLLLRATGYAASCNLFSTERERRLAEKLCKEFLSPALVHRAMENSHVVSLPIRCDEIHRVVESQPKAEKFTMFFGGRLTANKQWQKVLADYEKFFSSGRGVDLIVCAPLGSTSLFKAERWGTWGEINLGLPRDTYLKKLASCHVSMSNSIEEGFTVGIIEQIYSGLVVILPRKDWVEGLLGGAYDDYPFLYDGSHTAAYAMLKAVFENYPEARAKMEPTRKYIRENYDTVVVSQRTFDIMESYVQNLRKRVKRSESEGFRTLVDRVIEIMPKEIGFTEFVEKIKQYTAGDVSGAERNYRSGFPSRWQMYQYLIQRGYVDSYQFQNPTLAVREGESS